MQILANVPAFYRGTSPNKFFDYLAAGLPVLNNYPGWIAETIIEAKCGVAPPPESPELFADALQSLDRDPEVRRTMGQAARRLAESRFSRDALGEQFVAWLESTPR